MASEMCFEKSSQIDLYKRHNPLQIKYDIYKYMNILYFHRGHYHRSCVLLSHIHLYL